MPRYSGVCTQRYNDGGTYGSGVTFCRVPEQRLHVRAAVEDSGQAVRPHYVGIVVKYTGSDKFILRSVRAIGARLTLQPFQKHVWANVRGFLRCGLVLKHTTTSTTLRIDTIRANAAVQRYTIGV
jgi:hypothetical protein